MRVHFVVHESFESAGAYLKWAEDRGYTISWSRVYAGEALPPNADEFDMLVVFGGPQSPRKGSVLSARLPKCAHGITSK